MKVCMDLSDGRSFMVAVESIGISGRMILAVEWRARGCGKQSETQNNYPGLRKSVSLLCIEKTKKKGLTQQ